MSDWTGDGWERPPERRAGRWVIAGLIVAGVAILVATTGVLDGVRSPAAMRDPSGGVITVEQEAGPPALPVLGSWRRLASPPGPDRIFPQPAWSGEQLFVWDGVARLEEGGAVASDAVVYDPAADRWERLPPSPLGSRFGSSVVWAGDRLIVWGGGRRSPAAGGDVAAGGAAYLPATARWELLPPAPIPERRFGALTAWTGEEMLVYGGVSGSREVVIRADSGAAYQPASDDWRLLPSPPAEAWPGRAGVWSGERFFVWTGRGGVAYDPARDRWRELPAPGVIDEASVTPVWTGDELVVFGLSIVGSDIAGVRYAPDDGFWRRIDGCRPAEERSEPAWWSTWTGEHVVVWPLARAGQSQPDSNTEPTPPLLWDPATETCLAFPDPPDGYAGLQPLVWSGDTLLVWSHDGPGLLAWSP